MTEHPKSTRGAVAPTEPSAPALSDLRLRWGGMRGRFLAVALPTVVALNLAASLVFGWRAASGIEHEMADHRRHLLDAGAVLLAEALQAGRLEAVRVLAEKIGSEHEVARVVVRDAAGRSLAEVGTAAVTGGTMRVPLLASPDARSPPDTPELGTLELGYRTAMLLPFWRRMLAEETLRIVFLSGGIALIVLVAFRRHAGEPLRRLVEAIEASTQDGERRRVEWPVADEFGHLVARFNTMQDRLKEVERRRQRFAERVSFLYNRTPAMLHSVDREGHLIHVSDYWLIATGYGRREVIGRKLSTFLTPESAEAYDAELLPRFAETGRTSESPLRLIRADGKIMDVMLTETGDTRISPEFPLSLSVMTDISRTKKAERELARLAATDPVTGLQNRRGFLEGLSEVLGRSERALVLCLDLDKFKRVNDTYGHAAGDELLKAVARRLSATAGRRAVVGRLGGDEFAVCLDQVPDDGGEALGEALLQALRRPVELESVTLHPSGSVGLAVYPADGPDADQVLHAADMALYRAKETGRGRVYRYDDRLSRALKLREERERDLRDGLDRGWFELFAQPVVRLSDARIVGADLVLRLRHPDKGVIEPEHFLQIAEETGLIESLGRQALTMALELVPALVDVSAQPGFLIFVNLSGRELTGTLPRFLADRVRSAGISPGSVGLDVAETALADRSEEGRAVLAELAGQGFHVVLDDFGEGPTALATATGLPLGLVKLGGRLTRALVDGERTGTALVEATVALGRRLGVTVVAKGIATAEQAERVTAFGVAYGQGRLFAPALPIGAFMALLASSAPTLPSIAGRRTAAS